MRCQTVETLKLENLLNDALVRKVHSIDIIAVNSSGEHIKQEMQLNHMSVIPNESDTDTG
jgi:hypothetical protein